METTATSRPSEFRLGRTRTSDTDGGHVRVRDRAARKLHIHTSSQSHDQQDLKHRHHHVSGDSHKSGHAVAHPVQFVEEHSVLAPHGGVSEEARTNASNEEDDRVLKVPQRQIRPADVEMEKRRSEQREAQVCLAT